jgi:hypothetical protein
MNCGFSKAPTRHRRRFFCAPPGTPAFHGAAARRAARGEYLRREKGRRQIILSLRRTPTIPDPGIHRQRNRKRSNALRPGHGVPGRGRTCAFRKPRRSCAEAQGRLSKLDKAFRCPRVLQIALSVFVVDLFCEEVNLSYTFAVCR